MIPPHILAEAADAYREHNPGPLDGLVAALSVVSAAWPVANGRLREDDVEWIVNDNSELGIKIGDQFFFLYKGHSLVYADGKHDDGSDMHWRLVGKREFGECCRPLNGAAQLGDGGEWRKLSGAALSPPSAPAADVRIVRVAVASDARNKPFAEVIDYCENDAVEAAWHLLDIRKNARVRLCIAEIPVPVRDVPTVRASVTEVGDGA